MPESNSNAARSARRGDQIQPSNEVLSAGPVEPRPLAVDPLTIEPDGYLTLTEAAKRSPGRPSTNCIWRWCRRGIRTRAGDRIRLEHIRLGGKILTTEEWLRQFAQRTAAADTAYFDQRDAAGELARPRRRAGTGVSSRPQRMDAIERSRAMAKEARR